MWQFGVEGRRDGASLRAAAPQVLPGTKCISPRLRVGLLTTPCNKTHIVHPVICPPMLCRTIEYNFSALLRTAGKITFHVSMS